MPKVTLDDLTNLQNETSAVNTINSNSAAIEAAIENTLSRDGTSPNEMNANLDMNNYRILNLPAAALPTEPIRKTEFDDMVGEIPHARQHAQEAKDARDFAHAWATEAEDVPVDDGVNPSGFSAYHWAQKVAKAVIGELNADSTHYDNTDSGLTATNVQDAIDETNDRFLLRTVLPGGTVVVERLMQDKLRESVSVKDFGAVGDGVADDTAAIQAAIDSGARRIIAPAGGTYRITNTLTIDVDGVEFDFNHSTLLLDDATGLLSHILLGDGTTKRNAIRVRNVTFVRQQAATAGYAIDSDNIGVCEITGCRIYGNNKIWRGIRIYRGIVVNIQNNFIDYCVNIGIHLEGSGTGADRTVDVTIRGNRVDGCSSALFTWDFVEGVFCRDNIFYNASDASVVVDASSNANGLMSFKFQENDFDGYGSVGLYIDKVSNVQVTDCWFSSDGIAGLQLKEQSDGVVVSDNQFYSTANSNAIACSGNAAQITGNLISGGATCIAVGVTATNTSISGNTLSNAQYGVDLGTATNTHFVGNSIYGMSGHGVAGVGGAGTVVQNNKGDSAVGTSAFIAVGASPFTYTAGPRPEYVSIYSGTVSEIKLGSNAIGFGTNMSVMLAPHQSVTVTYSSAPFMVKNIL